MYIPEEIIRLIISYQRPSYPFHDQMIDYIKNKDNISYMFSFTPTIKNVLCFTNQRIPDSIKYDLPCI